MKKLSFLCCISLLTYFQVYAHRSRHRVARILPFLQVRDNESVRIFQLNARGQLEQHLPNTEERAFPSLMHRLRLLSVYPIDPPLDIVGTIQLQGEILRSGNITLAPLISRQPPVDSSAIDLDMLLAPNDGQASAK
jgi:hypothetical protein